MQQPRTWIEKGKTALAAVLIVALCLGFSFVYLNTVWLSIRGAWRMVFG